LVEVIKSASHNTDKQDQSFADKIVLVTGGSSGIGKQVAKDLLSGGADVIICSNDSKNLHEAHSQLLLVSPRIDAFVCDVRNTDQVLHLAHYVLERYGKIDILMNNAGYAVYRPFEESSIEEILDIVDVNLFGAMRCTKVFLPSMIARRSGRIVNISSIAGETIITPNATYCAAKHGMVSWTRAIQYELAHFNIGVNVVCVGHTKTSFHDHPTFRRRDVYRKKGARLLTVEAVSAKILDAIRKDRVVTYVPWWQGLVVWALNALPFVTMPIWDRVMQKRIAQLYEQIETEKKAQQIISHR
jgi:short-subunit dehydrogenase